jgi:hypothetical protein
MTAPAVDPRSTGRATVAAGGLALAALFGALAFLVLLAPVAPGTPWWAEWSVRVFGALIFGSIAGLGLYGFVVSVRGPREPPLPPPLLTRCPACGERILPTTNACPACGRSPGRIGRAWREERREGDGGLFAGGLGGGLVSLGILMVGLALTSGEGLLRGILYASLGLLLGLVGGAMVFGSLVLLGDAIRDHGRRTFALSTELDGAAITARAVLTPEVADLRGTTTTSRAFEEGPAPPPFDAPTPPALRALVRTLAALHARGEATFSYHETLQWTAGADDEPTRLVLVDLVVCTLSPDVADPPVDARDHILSALDEGVLLRDLGTSLGDYPELRNAFETYAAGVEPGDVDPHTTRILAAALAGGGGPAPYRQPG